MSKKLVIVLAVALTLGSCIFLREVVSAGTRYYVHILIVNQSDRVLPIHARQVMPLETIDKHNSALKNGGRCDLQFVITADEVPAEISIMTTDDQVIEKYRVGEARDMTFNLTIPREGQNGTKSVR